jgi:hypothetical protein
MHLVHSVKIKIHLFANFNASDLDPAPNPGELHQRGPIVGSIPASVGTVESEGRQMKQC